MHPATGTLYVVATPIGNLDDLSARAIETLHKVDLVAAEDTRRTGTLLTHLGLRKRMLSFHAHNEASQTKQLIEILQSGKSIALVSDAGTPLISDPGYPLVQDAAAQNITVCPIPGASALLVALSASGLPCDRFVFEGFLPAKRTARVARLEQLKAESRTLVLYESPHRIEACIQDLASTFGADRTITIARELTKTFEQFFRGTVTAAQAWLNASANHLKGEFVIVTSGCPQEAQPHSEGEKILPVLLEYLSVKQAVRAAAQITGEAKNDLYKRALDLRNNLPENHSPNQN